MVCVPMQERGDEVIIHRAASLGQQTGMRDMNRYRKYNELEAEASLMGEDERYEQIDRLLSFRYPHESSSVKSKYSVTELNRIGAEEDVHISLPKPMFSIGKKRLSASEIGTAVHTVMEKLEFATALREGKSYVVDMIGKLEADGTIPEESSRYIDVEKITAFFASDIGARAAAAQRLEKEREFIMQMELEGTETIVQGIIDCYFCEADGIVLIDYKNVKLIPGSTEADIAQRYCRQIDVYRNALEAAEGRNVKEAYLYLFDLKKFIKIPRKVINKC
jgi:ATP-dependent helicase/nuclease subunit A